MPTRVLRCSEVSHTQLCAMSRSKSILHHLRLLQIHLDGNVATSRHDEYMQAFHDFNEAEKTSVESAVEKTLKDTNEIEQVS